MEKKKAYILPHTHWDREWRYPIWKNRMLLVNFMEELLHILDTDEEYRCFLLDGQVAPILDYLEVMPEMHEKVTGYIKDGRIAVGPWYTLPDLYPVDGECLIRNLLAGTRAAEKLGKCLNVGYNSFGWGQTAQFPQIYAGFGIDFIICAKRVSEERAPQSEFWWRAPDGTTTLTSRLGEHARGNFYFNAYLYAKYGVNCFSADFKYSPEVSGAAIHNASPERRDEDFFVIRPNMEYDEERLKESFADAWKATDATAFPNHRLFLNGTDFSTPQAQVTNMRKDLQSDSVEFLHCRLEEYAEAIKENLDGVKLLTIDGELRDGPACDCSGNALSSRIYLKTLNKRAETALMTWAEPFSTALWALGSRSEKSFLQRGWDYLLKSHPHDSINGVTQDKTANDVEYRLSQALEIGETMLEESAATIAKRLDLSKYKSGAMLLMLLNPHPFPVREVITVNVATPQSENIWRFSARETDGTPLAIQEIARDEKAYPVHDMEARPWPFAVHRHLCMVETGEIPAMGYKIIEIIPEQRFGPNHFYWIPMRRVVPENILRGDMVMENEFLRVEFLTNGSLNLTHKKTGIVYSNLHYLEDAGDVGNYWAYYPPYHNQIHTTQAHSARIWSEECGPLSATIAVEYKMELPKGAEESDYGVRGGGKRSDDTDILKVISRFTLRKGSERLEVTTNVRNNVQNHRLRVAFPTGIKTEYSDAAGHFTVDRRDKINQQAKDGSYWPEMQTLPMQSFVDVSDGEKGLALLNSSLTEYELANDENTTLYLTLFRAMGNMIVTWWEAVGRAEDQKGSQLLRDMEFRYAIYPHEGDWQQGGVYRQAEMHNAPVKSWQLCGGGEGDLPLHKSFCEISNPHMVLSALKESEDRQSVILRLYNTTSETQRGEFSLGFNVKSAWRCNLNEERVDEIPVIENSRIMFEADKGEIVTVEVIV